MFTSPCFITTLKRLDCLVVVLLFRMMALGDIILRNKSSQTAGDYKVRQLLESLSEVMLHEDEMAYHFWVLMFPVVWGSLSDNKDNQIFLAKPIIMLLSQEYHHQQAHKRPNVIPVSL